MPTRPLALRRPDVRIIDRITREQITQLILAHPTAEAIARQALLVHHPQSRWWQRGKPIHIWLFTDDVPSDHLYQVENAHKTNRHEITVTLNRRLPPEYRNAFRLYGLGLALERMNLRDGEQWCVIGSQMDPKATRAGLDMIALSEGHRAVTELPWKRVAA